MIRELPAACATAARAAASRAGATETEWALEPLLPFQALLRQALELAAAGAGDTGSRLDLYLAVCGLDQVLSDHLHRHAYDLSALGRLGVAGRLARPAGFAARAARRAWLKAARGGLVQRERSLYALAGELAVGLMEADRQASSGAREVLARLADSALPAELRRRRLKLPQAFRGVDLYPEDCRTLGLRALAEMGDRPGPVLVVGLRTSGLYMAPLCAAAMRSEAQGPVELMSLRPGVPPLGWEERQARRVARAGGWAFVVDDPSWWGGALAQAGAALADLGFTADRLCFASCELGNQPVFRLLEPGELPLTPAERRRVWAGFAAAHKARLRPGEWHVHRLLEEQAVERLLNRPEQLARLGARRATVIAGHPFEETGEAPAAAGLEPGPPRPRRFHVKKLYEVVLSSEEGERSIRVLAKGAGLGVFGAHSRLLAERLEGLVPRLLAADQGILISEWLPGARLAAGRLKPETAAELGAYVAERARRLRLPATTEPAPEIRAVFTSAREGARLLCRGAGRGGSLGQYRAADLLAKGLRPPERVVVDGQLGPAEWVVTPAGLRKTDYEEHGVDIVDRLVQDPAFDLAGIVWGFGLAPAEESRLVAEYAARSGDRDLDARLTFYKLVLASAELASLPQPAPGARGEAERTRYAGAVADHEDLLTGSLNGFLARRYLAGAGPAAGGEPWALDLDDTLESERLGFPATSPAGARALRALAAHGHPVYLCTGRSLAELAARCRDYALPGGVAEYGAVIWDARRQEAQDLVRPGARDAMAHLRRELASRTDVLADPRYERSLRLFRHVGGARRGVPRKEVLDLIEELGLEGLEVTEGFRKTVVVAAGTDKGPALEALLRRHRRGTDGLHAVGDAWPDLGMLALARHRHAPANAGPELRARAGGLGLRIARRPHQAGVLEIVLEALHGRSRDCELCAPPALGASDSLLAGLAGLQDLGRVGRLRFLLHPATLRAFER